MDYNFHSGILLGDAHSKYIIIILVIDSWNFRKLQEWFSEFERHKDRIQNGKYNTPLKKRCNLNRISILKPQSFILWAGSITNEIILLYSQNINKHKILLLSSKGSAKTKRSNFTPIKTVFVAFVDIWRIYVYTYCTKAVVKKNLLKRAITQKKFLNYLLVGLTKFPD